MDRLHQLVAVTDEGHLHLGEAPHVLQTGVVLRHLELEAATVIGVLQRLAVQVLIGLLHLVGVDHEAGEQGQVGGLGADLLGKQAVLLGAVLVLLDDLPPAGHGLLIGEGFGVVVPEALGGVQGIAVAQQVLVHLGGEVAGIEGGHVARFVVVKEDVAVDILGLKDIAEDVAGVGFQHALLQDFVLVHVHDDHVQTGVGGFKIVLRLHHLGGGGVDVDLGVLLDLLQSLLIQLVVGHIAPLVIDGAEELGVLHLLGLILAGILVVAALVVALTGRAVVRLLVVIAAAGRQAQQHGQGQQEG